MMCRPGRARPLGEVERRRSPARCRPSWRRRATSPRSSSARRPGCRAMGCAPRTSTPSSLDRPLEAEDRVEHAAARPPGETARRARICSAPISSGLSARIDVPPAATSRSLATPSAGFAVMPRERVRAAALQAEDERRRRPSAPAPARAARATEIVRSHAPGLDRGRDAAGSRPARGTATRCPRAAAASASQRVVLGHADDERRGDVGVGRRSRRACAGRAPSSPSLGAGRLVHDGDRAVDGLRDPRGGEVRRGAHGHDEHVVAHAAAAVGAPVAGQRGASHRPREPAQEEVARAAPLGRRRGGRRTSRSDLPPDGRPRRPSGSPAPSTSKSSPSAAYSSASPATAITGQTAKPRGPSPGPHQATMTCAPAAASSGWCSGARARPPATIEPRAGRARRAPRARRRTARPHRRAPTTSSSSAASTRSGHRRARRAAPPALPARARRSRRCRRRPGWSRPRRAARSPDARRQAVALDRLAAQADDERRADVRVRRRADERRLRVRRRRRRPRRSRAGA